METSSAAPSSTSQPPPAAEAAPSSVPFFPPTSSSFAPVNGALGAQLAQTSGMTDYVMSDADTSSDESDVGEIWHDGRGQAKPKPSHTSAQSVTDNEEAGEEATQEEVHGLRPWWLGADGRINRTFYEFTPPKATPVVLKLLEMKEARLPQVRPGRDVSRLDPKEKRDTQEGLLMQSRGEISARACDTCRSQRGAFTSCVVVPSVKRICASCRLAHKPCDLNTGPVSTPVSHSRSTAQKRGERAGADVAAEKKDTSNSSRKDGSIARGPAARHTSPRGPDEAESSTLAVLEGRY